MPLLQACLESSVPMFSMRSLLLGETLNRVIDAGTLWRNCHESRSRTRSIFNVTSCKQDLISDRETDGINRSSRASSLLPRSKGPPPPHQKGTKKGPLFSCVCVSNTCFSSASMDSSSLALHQPLTSPFNTATPPSPLSVCARSRGYICAIKLGSLLSRMRTEEDLRGKKCPSVHFSLPPFSSWSWWPYLLPKRV